MEATSEAVQRGWQSMKVYDKFADEYIDEMEKEPSAPPERYIELSEELILQNAARWFCQAFVDDSAEE